MTRRARTLSAEEAALWAQIARSTRPLPGRRLPDPPTSPAPPRRRDGPPERPAAMQEPARRRAPQADQSAPQTGLDRRLARSLRRGTAEVDATLDLHGCTQAEAHQRLVHFVQAAALRGNVILRIITGKGARGEGSESGGGRGILRRRVPEWLAEAPLGPLIRGVTVAGPRQGGDGALYVVLKRGRG